MAETAETEVIDHTAEFVDIEILEDGMPDGQAPAVQGQQQGGQQQGQRRYTAAQQAYIDRQAKLGQLVDAINKTRTQIEAFLKPLRVDFDFFKAAAVIGLKGTMKNDPDFFHSVHVSSFLEAVLRAAKDGLLPDGKQCAIARFKNEAAYMPMVEGYCKILFECGLIRDINHNVVIEGDAFEWEEGTHLSVRHRPSLTRDPQKGKAVAAWCLVRTVNGGEFLEVVVQKDLEAIARVNKSTKGPRGDWAGEMHRKAPFRRLLKRLPKHPRLTSLIEHEEMMVLPAPTPETPREVRHAAAATIGNDELFGGGRPRPTKAAQPDKPAPAKGKGEGGRKRKAKAQAGGAAVEETGGKVEAEVHQASPELMELIGAIMHAEAATDIAEMVQDAKCNPALAGATADEWAWVDETAKNAADKLGAVGGGEEELKGLIAVLTSTQGPKSYDGTEADLWAADILTKLSAMKADKQRESFWRSNLPHVLRARDSGGFPQAQRILDVATSKGLPVEITGG